MSQILYQIAKEICHEEGLPWTDPRTGKTYPPPQDSKKPKPKSPKKSKE